MTFLRKLCLTGLALFLCALSVSACKVTLESGEGGLYDKKNDVYYYHASTAYEAVGLGEEHGTLKVTDNISYKLHLIPGIDPREMVATEDGNILYASTLTLPTVTEMNAAELHICMDGATTVHIIHTVTDKSVIGALAAAYENAPDIKNPGYTPVCNYRVRFESPDYAGFYFTLTYVEFAEDIIIDDVSYGRCFFQNLFDGVFAPVDDTIHNALGLGTVEP